MKDFRKVILLAVLVVGLWGFSAYGQETLAPESEQEEGVSTDGWDVYLMPYFWMPSMDATSTINGLSGTVDLSFSDILDYLDFTAMGRMEAWNDTWGLTFDGLYMNLSADNSFKGRRGLTNFNLDINVRFGMADFGLARRLFEERFGDDNQQRLAFEPYVGLRYAYLRQKVDLNVDIPGVGAAGRSVGESKDWVEPFVGARIIWDLNDKLAINARSDAGGFGIGSASDLTWQVVVGGDYRLSECVTFNAGYRILDVDYSSGSGRNEFGIDFKAKGPFVGLTILF